jgi:hypothetical protein
MPVVIQMALALVGVASAAFATGFIAGRLFERWQWSRDNRPTK